MYELYKKGLCLPSQYYRIMKKNKGERDILEAFVLYEYENYKEERMREMNSLLNVSP